MQLIKLLQTDFSNRAQLAYGPNRNDKPPKIV